MQIECIRNEYQMVILICPYYYLNYDMSLSPFEYMAGNISVNRGFHDWHNAYDSNNKLIQDFLVCDKLFGRRFWSNKRWKKVAIHTDGIIDERNSVLLPNIWVKKYKHTWDENTELLTKMSEILGDKFVIVIPPIYDKVLSDASRRDIQKMAIDFQSTVSNIHPDIQLIDCSKEVNDGNCFFDYEHLNDNGKRVFSEIIRKKIFNC